VRYCLTCGAALALNARADARYCFTACRMVAYRRRAGGGKVSTALLDRLVEAGGPVSEVALLRGIEAAARQNWEAAAFILERRFPRRWARPRDRVAREADEP
jgi:hypothetical protein